MEHAARTVRFDQRATGNQNYFRQTMRARLDRHEAMGCRSLRVPRVMKTPNQLDVNVGGWQPIATAPHDGTMIELLGKNGKLDIGEWSEWSVHFDKTDNGIEEGVTGEFSTEYGEGPHTHWRLLTSLPP
jgi:hypothetical protein